MFVHDTRLHYTVWAGAPNPGLANLMLEQFGGPQRLAFRYRDGELSQLEIIGSIERL